VDVCDASGSAADVSYPADGSRGLVRVSDFLVIFLKCNQGKN
jgi:hypothetical protein